MFISTLKMVLAALFYMGLSLFFVEKKLTDETVYQLLVDKKYTELETGFDILVKNYADDYRRESELDTALYTFYRADPTFESRLNEWIQMFPKSAIAYSARGVYWTKMGWVSRGDKFINNTSHEQIDGMKFYFNKAIGDFEKAKLINKNITQIYCYEMEIFMSRGDHQYVEALRNDALEINFYSSYVRSYYLLSLAPRWGGSINLMDRELLDIKPFYEKNNELKVLGGRVFAELGDIALIAGDYEKSVGYLTHALEHGDYWQYYALRGEAYSSLGQVNLAIKDMEASLKLRANSPHVSALLGYNYGKARDFNKAIDNLSKSLLSEPKDASSLNLRGICYLQTGVYSKALEDFTEATIISPNTTEYSENLATAKEVMSNQ